MTAAPIRDLDRAHPRRMAVMLGLMPLFGLVTLVLALALDFRGDQITLLALGLATSALAFLPLVLDQGRRPSRRHIVLSTLCVFFVLSFVTPVFVYYIPADWPVDAPSYSFSNLMPRDVIRGQLTTILALACLLVGYALPVGRGLAAPIPRMRRDWSPQATLAVACLIIPLGWFFMLAGLFGVFSASLGSGFLGVLASAYTYGIALLAIALLRYRSLPALLLLAIVIPVTSAFGFFTGSKGAMLIAGLMVFLSIIVVRRRIAARWILAGILAASLVYPVGMFVRSDILVENTRTALDALRDPGDTLRRISDFISSNRPGDYFAEGMASTAARFDALGAASVIIRDTPRVAPFQYGRTLVLFFVAFVPRVLWPGKPTITFGQYITNVYGSGPGIESSTAPTQIGDFFMNFGYPGVIGGMILYGILLRIAHEVLIRGHPTTPALFMAVVLLRQLLDLEGSVAYVWSLTLMSIVPIVVAHLIVRTLFRSSAEPLRSDFRPVGVERIPHRSGSRSD